MKATKIIAVALLFIILISIQLFAQKKNIVYFLNPGKAYEDGTYYEKPTIDFLEEAGYNVIPFYSNTLTTDSEAKLDTLRVLADLILIGRAGGSGDFSSPNKEIWNSIEKPVISLMLWGLRNNRGNWFNTDQCTQITGNNDEVFNITVEEPDDPAFAGVDVSSGELPWMIGPYDIINTTDPGNGLLLATSKVDYTVQFVRFEPGSEFYPGAGDTPAGYRTYIGNGDDVTTDSETGLPYLNYFNFTDVAKQVFLNEIAHLIEMTTAVEKEWRNNSPKSFTLAQNYPNPFNPATQITYSIGKSGLVTLKVYNSIGQEMQTLVNEQKESGQYTVHFDATGFANGIYFYQLNVDNDFSETRKMILMK